MQYMLIFTETTADFAKRTSPAESAAYWQSWSAYCGELASSGIMVSGAGLQPPETATTVRVRGGKRELQSGANAGAELIGGFFVIEVLDLETALDWAARSPSSAYASTEVRPVLPPMQP